MQLLHYIPKCILRIPDEKLFSKGPSGAPLHTSSILYDVPVGSDRVPLFWSSVLLYLRSPRGGCCSTSDDLSCSIIKNIYFTRADLTFLVCSVEICVIEKLDPYETFGLTIVVIPHNKKKEKGRDLTQSYDKNPYTNRNVKRAKRQHKQRYKKVRLQSGCGPT